MQQTIATNLRNSYKCSSLTNTPNMNQKLQRSSKEYHKYQRISG